MIGIALSGGGARGIAHLGVLKALNEAGIYPEIVSGTSAGAIIGGFYCSGFSPEEILRIIIKTNMFSIFRPAFSWKGLLKMDKLEELLKENLPNYTFQDLKTQLLVTATDIERGKTTYFKKGDIIKPILASSCLPVLFSPIDINGIKYFDGGILNNLPVEGLVKQKINSIVAVSCNPVNKNQMIKSFKDVIERSAFLAINENKKRSKALSKVFIEPKELTKFTVFDLSKGREIFKVGYDYTKENMVSIKKKLKIV